MDVNGGLAALPFPNELRHLRPIVENYVQGRLKQFALAFARRLNPSLTREQTELLIRDTVSSIISHDQLLGATSSLRLVLRHDCQSTGCGDVGCLLCQFNPSRLCKRNLKQKYLIDDHLKAKCSAPLRVEVVDESGRCVEEGVIPGMQLEVHVLNGEKYREVCPDNTLLTHPQLKTCIIQHHQKALLKREGATPTDDVRVFLQLERGQAPLSELQVTTSSEALLCGKAPTFRLLVWAVDVMGEPVPNVTYVVSESFVVATKRVKHAIKSDIPSIADHVSKLVHIGKATVDKLTDLRAAAVEEGFEVQIPDDLNRVEKVGQFQKLVELTEVNSDLKNKVRHLLKLSPEKWEEVSQHALQAVVPDFRPRVWWCPAIRSGLLFSCKNGSVVMDHPIALVKMGGKGEEDQMVQIHQLDPVLFNAVPKLKSQAVTAWYAPGHPGWAIYWKEQDPGLPAPMGQGMQGTQNTFNLHQNMATGDEMQQMFNAGANNIQRSATPPLGHALPPNTLNASNLTNQGSGPIERPAKQQVKASASPFAAAATITQPMTNLGAVQPLTLTGTSDKQQGPGGPAARSPFATNTYQNPIQDAFPDWANAVPGNAPSTTGAAPTHPHQAAPRNDTHMQGCSSSILNALDPAKLMNASTMDLFKPEDLERGPSLWGLNSLGVDMKSADWLAQMGQHNDATLTNVPHMPNQMPNMFNMQNMHNMHGQLPPDGLVHNMDTTRQLSLKFTMSLDLQDVENPQE